MADAVRITPSKAGAAVAAQRGRAAAAPAMSQDPLEALLAEDDPTITQVMLAGQALAGACPDCGRERRPIAPAKFLAGARVRVPAETRLSQLKVFCRDCKGRRVKIEVDFE